MNAKDVLRSALEFNHNVLTGYLADLGDADLLLRVTPAANHIAWQLGHLIQSERQMHLAFSASPPGELPAGFAEQHAKDKASADTGFATKDEYLRLYNQVRQATLTALKQIPEADLDKPVTGWIARLAPTVGRVFLLAATHQMMHAGQFVPVRRKLGKPVLI
jgi:hypothetical protein